MVVTWWLHGGYMVVTWWLPLCRRGRAHNNGVSKRRKTLAAFGCFCSFRKGLPQQFFFDSHDGTWSTPRA